ncbi:transposase, partial [Desulfofundulus thermobenzoicus]
LAMITPETLIVGVDVAKRTHYAQMINFRGEGLHKPFPFQNTRSGIDDLVLKIRTIQFKNGLSNVLVAIGAYRPLLASLSLCFKNARDYGSPGQPAPCQKGQGTGR